ncbi:acetylornithine deacetylase [Spongiibacter nanhainus]|uniref:Acetylornithine deacetylase n=1 Tax=Spongiibacter nanhainus TaxID=2794344 RepID=A0A7T4R0J6_9GAMM|nr:acetylornithine deacetylase [Spongiibacter nanhainus]QQD18195.1 acetylornithine deacetylase [Spongiibacter nanhainus]
MTLPPPLQMISQLVAIPSISATSPRWDMGNRKVVELLAQWLEEIGFQARVMPLANPDKANLVATYGHGEGGLVLAGHTDTVPYDDSRWHSDPFTLDERDQRLYGLGTADMKGFFALAIEAIKPLMEESFKAPLIILATADEESSMDGARALVENDVKGARYAVIGEPTGLTPIRAHKGIMMENISITGRSGHSSNPALGNNALEAMHEVLSELLKLRAEYQARYHHPGFDVPAPTLNLGCLHGGDNPNRICGQADLHFDIRPIPGMELDAIRAELKRRLQPIAEQRGVDIALHPLMPGIAPFEEGAQSELVQTVEALTGRISETVGFATEASFLQKLGLQTLVMGPGSIDQAHQPDEFIALDQLTPSIELLRRLVAKFCLDS